MTDRQPSHHKPSVTAAIVTYNNRELLEQCLVALKAQTYPVAEIIVVDNASSDDTAITVRESFPEVNLRVLEDNRGVERGFCKAIRIASEGTTDWIWMMDDDAEPTPRALEELFAPGLHEQDDTVVLTSLKRFPSGNPQYDHSGWYDPVRAEGRPAKAAEEAWTEIQVGGYAGLLCRLVAIEEVGPPDPGFFFWWGDVEFCLRLAEVGRLYLVRNSTVIHHVSEKMRTAKGEISKPWRHYPLSYYWRFYYSYRNRFLILYRHREGVLDKLCGTITLLRKAVRSIAMVLVYHEEDTIEKIRLVIRGVYDGVLGRRGKRVDPERYMGLSES